MWAVKNYAVVKNKETMKFAGQRMQLEKIVLNEDMLNQKDEYFSRSLMGCF